MTDTSLNYLRFGCYHTACGRILPTHRHTAGLDDPAMDAPPSGVEPIRHIIEGARAYAAYKGLTDPHGGGTDYHAVRTNRQLLTDLAHHYDRLPDDDPAAHRHFAAMRDEVHQQYEHLTGSMGVRVEITDSDPYRDVHELRKDVHDNHRIRILGTHVTGSHPFFDDTDNDKFRAVHDIFGHLGTGRDFDRHGEEAAYQAHARMFSDHARPALTSETRGQNSSLIVNGRFGGQKIALLPRWLWHPGLASSAAVQPIARTSQVTAAQDDDYRMQHESPDPSFGAPMHDIESMMPDVYEHPEYYRHGTVGEDESLYHIRRVRGNPEAKVRIYRALPAEHAHKGFRTGDWVSPSKEYARQHAMVGDESGHDNWPVIRTTVAAKHLFNAGDPTEFGYHGPSRETAQVAFKGGRNQEVRQHADGVVRKVVRRNKEASVDRIAVLQGFNSGGRLRSVASYSGPRLRVYAHVSGNSIDAIHCPFCGSGAVFARSDGTIECSFCTSVYTVQVQPQFAAFPQTAEQMPYQWPGRPGPDQLAGGGDGAMGGFPGPIAGEQDQGGEEGGPEDGNPFGSSDDAGESDGDSGEGPADKDAPDKAQVGGKDKPPFGKKSYRTAAGHQLDGPDYLRHLAIGHAHRRGEVARLVRDSR